MNEKINEIIKNFDFEKVRKVMVALDWAWRFDDRSPLVGELVITAQRLLTEVVEKEEDWGISTGGFLATKRNGMLALKFMVEEWDVDLEEEE